MRRWVCPPIGANYHYEIGVTHSATLNWLASPAFFPLFDLAHSLFNDLSRYDTGYSGTRSKRAERRGYGRRPGTPSAYAANSVRPRMACLGPPHHT
jgi:hypothetical protein